MLWLAVDADTVPFRWCHRIRQIAEFYGRIQRYMVYGRDDQRSRLPVDWTSRDGDVRFISSSDRPIATSTELALTMDVVSQFLPYPSDSRSALVLVTNSLTLHLLTERVIRAQIPVIWLSTLSRPGLRSMQATRHHNIEHPGIKIGHVGASTSRTGQVETLAQRKLAARVEIKTERSPAIVQAVNRHVYTEIYDSIGPEKYAETPFLENRISPEIRAQMGRIALSSWILAHPRLNTRLDEKGDLWFSVKVERPTDAKDNKQDADEQLLEFLGSS